MAEWVVGLLVLLGVVLLFVIESAAYGGVGTWVDIRAARTAEDVRKNVEDYGPQAPGLKLHLLPEDERRAILAARAGVAGETVRGSGPVPTDEPRREP